MKKLKVLAISGLSLTGVAMLASCGGDDPVYPVTDLELQINPLSEEEIARNYGSAGSTLHINIDYGSGSKQSGVSFQQTSGTFWYGEQAQGEALPTWKALGEALNVTVIDSSAYSGSTNTVFTNYSTAGYVDGSSNNVDLVMGSTSNFNTAANNGELLSITQALEDGLMPNFYTWLKENDANGSIYNQMKASDGEIYYTPYFDGLNTVECMNLMNNDWVEKLLDGTAPTDATTLPNGTTYEATVSMTNQTINVANSSDTDAANGTMPITVTVDASNNPVTKQNALATKTGAELVKALKESLIAEYGSYVAQSAGGSATDANALYKNLSEIFTSTAACYHVDDLVALLRCVKACPETLTGDATTVITPWAPRSAQGNRTKQAYWITSWWGVRGATSESGSLYFGADGLLHDGRTETETLDALEHVHDLYSEGLIQQGFTTDSGGKANGSLEWRSNGMKDGTLFMVYDYNATTTANNANCNEGKSGFTDKSISLYAVCPPVANWGSDLQVEGETENAWFHFSEDNRALKSGGWCIPQSSDNKLKAIEMMDYLFCDEGADIQDYGPNTTYFRSEVTTYQDQTYNFAQSDGSTYTTTVKRRVAGNGTITISDQVCVKIGDLTQYVNNSAYGKLGWNDFCRVYIGSTQGIGHQRSDGLDYQYTGEGGRIGLNTLTKAITLGAVRLVQTDIDTSNTDLFFKSVPTSFALSGTEQATITNTPACTTVETFYKAESTTQAQYISLIMGGWDAVTGVTGGRSGLEATFDDCNNAYLIAYRNAYTRSSAKAA